MHEMKITRKQIFQNARTGEIRTFPRGSSVTAEWRLVSQKHPVPVSRLGSNILKSV